LPEIVVLNGVAAEDYAAWIRESTS
jgi:hypothetical protein